MTNHSDTQASDRFNIPQGKPNLLIPGSLVQISEALQCSLQVDLIGIRAEIEKLQSRTNSIISMLVAFVLILGGMSVWLAMRVLSFEQEPKTSTINAELSQTERIPRIEILEQELHTLKKFD